MNLFVSIDDSLYNYFRNKNMFFETKVQDVLDNDKEIEQTYYQDEYTIIIALKDKNKNDNI